MVEGLHVSFQGRHTLRKRSISLHCVLIMWIMAAWAVPGMSQSAAPANPVASLAIDPTTPTTLYAGTPIGVFKSTNGGITWSVPAMAMNVTSIAIDPSTPSTIYTNAFKSTDSGATWSAFTRPGPGLGATFVVIDPNSSSTLYAGGPGGLSNPSAFQSSDGGVTWSDISFGLNSGSIIHPTYDGFDSLVIDPATSTLLAGLVQGSSFAAIGKKPKTATGWQKNSISILGSRIRSSPWIPPTRRPFTQR